jgi:hypothetical protein
MRDRIVYQTAAGLVVLTPTGEVPLERVLAKDVPAGAATVVVDIDELPEDRTFRNAWKLAGRTVAVSVEAARLIAHDKRRALRQQQLAPLDEALALKIPGTDELQIESQRQALRDGYAQMQQAIDAATTPEQLKAALNADYSKIEIDAAAPEILPDEAA